MLLRVLFFVGLAFAASDLEEKVCDNAMKFYNGAVLQIKELSYPLEKKITENCDRLATAANTQECRKKIVPQFNDFLEVAKESLLKLSKTACKDFELSSWASSRCSATILRGLREFPNPSCQRAMFMWNTTTKTIGRKFNESMDLVNRICGNGLFGQGSSNGDRILGIFNDMNNKLKPHLLTIREMVCVEEEEALCKEFTGWSEWILGKVSQ